METRLKQQLAIPRKCTSAKFHGHPSLDARTPASYATEFDFVKVDKDGFLRQKCPLNYPNIVHTKNLSLQMTYKEYTNGIYTDIPLRYWESVTHLQMIFPTFTNLDNMKI